jgi:hypothetical protein
VGNRIGLIVGEKEGEVMKRHWLRGLLLGVSMALLLAGGVALAQGTLSVDKTCVECIPEEYWDGEPDHELPDDAFLMTITGQGWAPSSKCGDFHPSPIQIDIDGDAVYHELRWPNAEVWHDCAAIEPDGSFVWGPIAWPCEMCPEYLVTMSYEASVSQDECWSTLGEMEYYFEDDTGGRSVFVLLAEDCAAAEFVPEPGTLMLLGSGLAGLAGYAALRWRTRE